MQYLFTTESPVGKLTAASDGQSVTGLWLEGQKYFAANVAADAQQQALPVFKALQKWLNCYFTGTEPDFTLPLAPAGSAFRQSVWEILRKIPYGRVITYGEIAKQLQRQTGKPASARAVGGAVGHNPVSIIIPCHRVIGANGTLTGYAGGLEIKKQLLRLEKIPIGEK